MNAELLRNYTTLDRRRRELKAELAEVEDQVRQLQETLLNEFEQAGMSSIRQDGTTVYVHRQLWCNPKDGDYLRACRALRDAGLGDMVTERFNLNSVSAWVREQEKEGAEIPEVLQDALNINEVFSLRTRSNSPNTEAMAMKGLV